MRTMNVTAVAPKAVSTVSVRRCVLYRLFEAERERDGLERGLVLCIRNGDRQPPRVRLPTQLEERTALPLNREQFANHVRVYVLVEVDHKAPLSTVSEAGAGTGVLVSLVL
jgi:hypothetical protein